MRVQGLMKLKLLRGTVFIVNLFALGSEKEKKSRKETLMRLPAES